MKNPVSIIAAGVFVAGTAVAGVGLVQQPAHAASNCRAYAATTPAANRAITAACREVAKGTPYSWAGGHAAVPGPSTGVVHDGKDGHFDDRNRVGLDCSGLVRWAWFQATGTDFGAGGTQVMPAELTSHGFVRTGENLPTRPGDIIVYPGHTAIYLGAGLVVQAANQDAGLNVAGLSSEPAVVTGVFRYVGAAVPQPAKPRPSRPRTPAPKPTPKATPKKTPKPATKRSAPKPTPRSVPKPTHHQAKPKQPTRKAPDPTVRTVRADAPTYLVPVAWHDVGILHRGKRHFSCQVLSVGHSYGGKHSNWWLKTNDSSGNHNVWVNATYLSGSGDDRVPGIPTC